MDEKTSITTLEDVQDGFTVEVKDKVDKLFEPRNRKERRAMKKLIQCDKRHTSGYSDSLKDAVKKSVYAETIQRLRQYYKEHEKEIEEIRKNEDGN